MTLLCEIIVPAKTKYLRPVLKTAAEAASAYISANDLQLILEEALINIINYSGSYDVEIRCFAEDSFIIEITDCGKEFDMTAHSRGEELTVGGYGVKLIKKIMDDVSYQRRNGINFLRMTKRLKCL